MSGEDDEGGFRRAELLLLGRIDGKLDGLKEQVTTQVAGITTHLQRQDTRLDAIEGRLRTQEQKAAVLGAASGGAMAVGTALIIEGLKAWWSSRGGQ